AADRSLRLTAARQLLLLAQALEIPPASLLECEVAALSTLIGWIAQFPEPEHGPLWLRAFEAGYQDHLLALLERPPGGGHEQKSPDEEGRPAAQAVFCIDVRCEPLRRHLEAIGHYQTFGFAGFFAASIRYYALGKEHYTEQFPAVMRARNEVREVPRRDHDPGVRKQQARAKLAHAGHTLLHELKENVVTPYVMVESLGWFYGLPLVAKTLWPGLYRRLTAWVRGLVLGSSATTLTVDKHSAADVEAILVAGQRAAIRKALRQQIGIRSARIPAQFIEALRQQALAGDREISGELSRGAAALALTDGSLTAILERIRHEGQLDMRTVSRQKERLTRTGFTLEEQVVTVETALRMMGFVRNFARLVLLCGHGSKVENNPFESALDCGACGGNSGKPNARLVAMMANDPDVRSQLARKGLEIPADTLFLAGLFDTATDQVELFDLEDVPETHRGDVAALRADLAIASARTGQERYGRLPDTRPRHSPRRGEWYARSGDWSQVRPEWGLSANTAFIIGPRSLTRGLDLSGRVFLQSYDPQDDPGGRWLEVIMTGAQLVAHWIAMEHYFSAVDNEVYGASSKVYHNVVGRVGVMSGPWSDLRLGLARQTVMSGPKAYHEPMRLLT
ncbi:MAG: DUF2309 family protein, partial [Cyanobacteria bacterium REEB65]|nr:DUF2309 family protein [Cyanobacteria bacterium REEB65]